MLPVISIQCAQHNTLNTHNTYEICQQYPHCWHSTPMDSHIYLSMYLTIYSSMCGIFANWGQAYLRQ